MGEPIGKGLKQLMRVGGMEAVAESERLQSVRKLKDRYWVLKRSIDKQENDLETIRKQNSLKMLQQMPQAWDTLVPCLKQMPSTIL